MDEVTKRELQAVLDSLPEMREEKDALAEMISENGINVLVRPDAYSILCSKLDWLANPSKYTSLPYGARNSDLYTGILNGKKIKIEKSARIYQNIFNYNYLGEIINANSQSIDVQRKALDNFGKRLKLDFGLDNLEEANIIEAFEEALNWDTNENIRKLGEIILGHPVDQPGQASTPISSYAYKRKRKLGNHPAVIALVIILAVIFSCFVYGMLLGDDLKYSIERFLKLFK